MVLQGWLEEGVVDEVKVVGGGFVLEEEEDLEVVLDEGDVLCVETVETMSSSQLNWPF